MCVCAGHVEGIIDVEKSLDQCGVCVCAGHVEGISDVEKSLDQYGVCVCAQGTLKASLT